MLFKRFISITLFLLIGLNSYSQIDEKFKIGAFIKENIVIQANKEYNSILFIFNDNTHLINYYLDLTKKIKKKFKKTTFKIAFNFDLTSEKPFESDLKLIPKKRHSVNSYDLICEISTGNMIGQNHKDLKKRRLNYDLNLKIIDSKKNMLIETGIINISTLNTIITQNDKTSDLILKIIKN